MKIRLILNFVLLAIIVFASSIVANAGATLKVNWVGTGNSCDSVLTLDEAVTIADGTLLRGLSTGEKNQISGATFIPAPPGPCGAVLWTPTLGVGLNSADNIVFENGLTLPIRTAFTLGLNDNIDGTTGSSKVILDGTGFIAGTCGIRMTFGSGSQIRNMEIRNFPACGIEGVRANGAVFEGNDIHDNGTIGIDLPFFGGVPIANARNIRIGGDQPQHRNRIFSNGLDGIRIVASETDDRSPGQGIFILNNLIGTSDGVTDNGNGRNGINLVNAFGITIGDSTGATHNIISGNNNDGITMTGVGVNSVIIIGNFIGTSETSGAALGNTASGVAFLNGAGSTNSFNSGPNRVGMPGLPNVISANNVGVFVGDPNTSLNLIQSNYIGTNIGGNTDLGNTLDGVRFVNGTFDNQVGGTGAGEGNLIAFNQNGIFANTGVRNSFKRNRMFSNDLLGIDLAPVGVTPNDAGDGDSGPNNLQNYPVITYVNAQTSSVTLNGTFNSTPNQTYTIEFFGNSGLNGSGLGEGRNYLGSTQVTTNASGNAFFFGLSLSATLSSVGNWVTATATDATNNTSEFSAPAYICSSTSASPVSVQAPIAGGQGNFTVITSSGCSNYTVASASSWISVLGTTAGTVTYNVAANTGPPRDGFINITYNNGSGTSIAQFLISQNNGCTYNLSHFAASYPAGGSNSDGLTLSCTAGCIWVAQSNNSWITLLAGSSGSGNGTVTWSVAPNTGPARQGTLSVAGHTFTVNQAAFVSVTRRSPFDYDGDNKSDISIFRPNGASGAEWWYLKSSNGGNGAFQFGSATDKIVPSDFTGDNKTDIAFWRPSTGFWYVLRSEDLTFYSFPFGSTGDIPAPADYDGDNKADAAVFRPSTATWYISRSSGGTTIQQFGQSADVPVAADYDGDGKSDIAIYRPSLGQWWIARSSGGTIAYAFGSSTDKIVAGDYTGDGKADIAFWRPSTGTWYIQRSEDATFFAFPFGSNGDTPVPGDYDGDGKFDGAVFRSSTNTWYVNRSSSTVLIQAFGIAGDLPTPNAYVR